AQTTRPYEKRTHALVACDSCRKLRLRCEKKEDSDFCVRCIDGNKEDCIFNKGRKRGRKPGSKNKQKVANNKQCWPELITIILIEVLAIIKIRIA
ncbi:20684_t:CDS:2, partial [Entrophospora sp. SA101]